MVSCPQGLGTCSARIGPAGRVALIAATRRRSWASRLARGGAVGQVGAGLSDQLAGPVERVERARIRPPALDDLAGQLATREVPVVHVGVLERDARRRAEGAGLVEQARVGQGTVGDRIPS